MDVQDQTTPTITSGNENHGVHICRRCGWAFPNPHPSARHRRAHKKICGTIEGFTNLIESEVVSDDEHHLDDDKEKTPSPVIEKKKSINESGGIGRRSSRSEEDLFSDAVTEFSDSVEDRSAVFQDSNKTLDRDLYFSFKDADSFGVNEVLNAPIEISKVDASLPISENLDTHMEKNGKTEITTECDSSEAKLELPEMDGKFEPTPEQSDVSQPLEAESVELVEKREEKVQEFPTSETIKHAVPLAVTEEAKDAGFQASEMENLDKLSEVVIGEKSEPAIVEGISEEIKHEKMESDHEHASEVVKESEIDQRAVGVDEEIKHERLESDYEHASEVVKEFKIDQRAAEIEEFKHEKFESDQERPSEVVEEPETDEIKREKFVSELLEVVKESGTDESVSVLTEKVDLGAPHSEKCSNEQIEEVVKISDTDLIEKKDLEAPILEKCSNEHTHKAVEEPDSVLAEKEDFGAPILEKEQTQEVVEEPASVLAEKEDFGAPILEKEQTKEVVEEPASVLAEKEDFGAPNLKKEHTHEVVEQLDSVLAEKEDLGAPNLKKVHTQEVDEEPDSVLAEKQDLDAPILEKSLKEHTHEVVEEPYSVLAEKEDLDAPMLEKSSKEHTHEVVEEPDSVLAEKEDLGAAILEKSSKDDTHEVFEQLDSILAEKEDLDVPILEKSSKDHTHEVAEEPDTALAEKEDLDAPILEKISKEHIHEVVVEPDSVLLTEKEDLGQPNSEKFEVVEELDSGLTENKDLGAPNSEKCSKEHYQEVIKETIVDNDTKNASGVVSEPIVDEVNGKLMPIQDSGVDLSVDSGSRNSLEGNWGSVSVLSTASIDAEASHSIEKSKLNSGKLVAADNSHLGSSDVFEPPSFMTLVEPKGEDQKPGSGSQDSNQQPKSEPLQAGWFPTLTNVSNESEGRKRNEEVIAKVTTWNTGKHSTPLKNLLGEAKSPTAKQQPPPTAVAAVAQKDEAPAGAVVPKDEAGAVGAMSPPKLIEDGKNGRKKVKGRGSWMPFVCCSSVNVVN